MGVEEPDLTVLEEPRRRRSQQSRRKSQETAARPRWQERELTEMELALVLQDLLRRRRALAAGLVVALIAALMSVYRIEGFGLKPRGLRHSSASTEVFVDTPSSVLGSVTQAIEPLQARATAYANFMASPAMLSLVGRHAGIAGDRLYAAGPVDATVPRVIEEPTAVVRNVQITGETAPYRLNFSNDPNLPTIGIAAQAPTTQQAVNLADAAAWALRHYVAGIQASNDIPSGSRVVIRQLGPATGGVSDAGISKALASMVFVFVFVVWCVGLLLAGRFRESWRAAARVRSSDAGEPRGEPRSDSKRGSRQGPSSAGKRSGASNGRQQRATPPAKQRSGASSGKKRGGTASSDEEEPASRNGRAKRRVRLPIGER